MTTPSTEQTIINDMADLVVTTPDRQIAMMTALHKAIHERMVAAGLTDEQRYDFWTETFVSMRSFALLGKAPNER